MKILEYSSSSGGRGSHIIAVFGLGLIGKSILSRLNVQKGAYLYEAKLSWENEVKFRFQTSKILDRLHSLARQTVPVRISVVWSAGKVGFSATREECLDELAPLSACLDMVRSLAESIPAEFKFHFISSAGGLYEGLRNVSQTTAAQPLRPYGKLKAAQEQYVSGLPNSISTHIYRPSTVYGNIKEGRAGLISTLLTNGLTGQTTRIVGSSATLRDFVSVDDVGRIIATNVLYPSSSCSRREQFIISGKPSSIFEAVKLTEALLRKKVYVHYQIEGSNALDNTYSPGLIPHNFLPISLPEGMRAILRNWKEVP